MLKYFSFALFLILYVTVSHATFASETETVYPGIIQGNVIDTETGEPLTRASILILELQRGTVTDDDGYFEVRNIQPGEHLVHIRHIGYELIVKQVIVTGRDTVSITVEITKTVFRGPGIEVVGSSINEDITTYVERVLSGHRLRQQLGRTIAETLEDEPGLAQRSMGPAPARPVMRGLGGDRLLILEDGGRTGDLSGTSADHALAIEPMTAEHIEFIRGPSALVYGSNTLGGVINVIRGQIPVDRPNRMRWSGSLQGETVNKGAATGFRAYGPAGDRFAYRADLSLRSSGDINTPNGRLSNTGITTLNTSLGVSYIQPRFMLGVSGSLLDSDYGVPGGEGVADAHPNGVDIDLFRRYLEIKFRYNFEDSWFRRLDIGSTYAYYVHEEVEKPMDMDPIIGARFGVLTTHIRSDLHHNGYSFVEKGLFGIWLEHRDYDSAGVTFTPASVERAAAFYLYQESNPGLWNLQGAIRFDYRQVEPRVIRPSIIIGDIITREFGDYSGSLMVSRYLGSGIVAGGSVMRSFRAPGLEELYSEGPHLGTYTYEAGNPQLKAEYGLGTELFVRMSREKLRLNAVIFRNGMNNFIFPQNQGRPSTRRDDLPKYQFSESRVLMHGAELDFEFKLNRHVISRGIVSYVRGDFIDEEESFPLLLFDNRPFSVPMMPPLTGRFDLEYNRSSFRAGIVTRMAGSQNRIDEFEKSTDGYILFDFYLQYHLDRFNLLHTITFNVENITDNEYRNHLSRIKMIMPEQGRNFKLLYRVYF